MRAFCNPGIDNVILLPPTYGMYEVSAGINNIQTRKVNLTSDYQLRTEAILEAADEKTKVIFICSPNNPSGNKVKRTEVRKILENFEGLVVVDEAYIDFSDEPSFIDELSDYPNLLVMQTFSKAWGLASLRMGMAFASPEIIRMLNLIKPPYNISGLTQEKVLEALNNADLITKVVGEILKERTFLEKMLGKLSFVHTIYPSNANFLLIKVTEARRIYEYLIAKTIIIRDRSRVVMCEDCLRISVGTRKENNALVDALNEFDKK
jgi:histidinol-phosphate aminotransferase